MQVDVLKNLLILSVSGKPDSSSRSSISSGISSSNDWQYQECCGPSTWRCAERSQAGLARILRLPISVDAAAAHASFSEGVLTINCPKKPLGDTSTELAIN